MADALKVSFLITDFSGNNIVRFARVGTADGACELGGESAQTVPLTDTVYQEVLRKQQVDVRALGAITPVMSCQYRSLRHYRRVSHRLAETHDFADAVFLLPTPLN